MSQTINLGSVTAYASACEGGYTGTYAEFCTATANVAQIGELQTDTMPTATADHVGQVVQYIGATGDYTHGFFYECVNNSGTYSWQNVPVQIDNAGHVIVNSSGTDMTQREKLKFVGANVTDDSTNGQTVVNTTDASDNTVTFTDASDDETITSGTALKTIISLIKYKLAQLLPSANVKTTYQSSPSTGQVYDAAYINSLAGSESVQVTTSGWSAGTTSVAGKSCYYKSLTLTHPVYCMPEVKLNPANGVPTAAEETLFDCLDYYSIDDANPTTLKLYAVTKPTSSFYINVIRNGGRS